MSALKVAIVGRPNVGKSSLFNWLARRRIAIVDPTAGVTRDRLTTMVSVGDRSFELIDTGGMGLDEAGEFSAEIKNQIETAIKEADVILWVVDAREGIVPLDKEVARRLRGLNKPVLLAANKCDSPELEPAAQEFYKLGQKSLVCVSAKQNRNKEELLQGIVSALPDRPSDGDLVASDVQLKLAIVGRRNTGKSTFINALAKSERVIVSEVPGTTRDSVDVHFQSDDKTFIAIDTAGVRKKAKVSESLEFYSLHRAERSIRRADVVLLFLDAPRKISKVDKQLAGYILEHHKPAIFVINKWDLMRPMATGTFADYVRATFPSLDFVPMAFITAKTGRNVHAVLNLAQNLHKQASARVGTGELNRVLREAVAQQEPPLKQNRRARIFYCTQAAANPPTIVLFTNGPELFDHMYQRYLLNVFRDQLPFADVPIKLYLRNKRRGDDMSIDREREESRVPALKTGRTVGQKRRKQAKSDIWRDV